MPKGWHFQIQIEFHTVQRVAQDAANKKHGDRSKKILKSEDVPQCPRFTNTLHLLQMI